MKFEYDGKATENNKPVAAIHISDTILFEVDRGVFALGEGEGAFCDGRTLDFWDDLIVKKFYPGDKITITF